MFTTPSTSGGCSNGCTFKSEERKREAISTPLLTKCDDEMSVKCELVQKEVKQGLKHYLHQEARIALHIMHYKRILNLLVNRL